MNSCYLRAALTGQDCRQLVSPPGRRMAAKAFLTALGQSCRLELLLSGLTLCFLMLLPEWLRFECYRWWLWWW